MSLPQTSWDPWYVTGLIEALGSFTFSRSGRNLSVYLAIKVPAPDRELVERLQEHLGGVGKIYGVRARSLPQTAEPSTTACYYRICRQADLLAVVDHLERFPLQGRKKTAFDVWKRMVELKGSYRRPPRADLDALAMRLSGERTRRPVDRSRRTMSAADGDSPGDNRHSPRLPPT